MYALNQSYLALEPDNRLWFILFSNIDKASLFTFGPLMACSISQVCSGQAGAAKKKKKVLLQRETVPNIKAVRKDMQKYSHMA